ncbi:TnsA endonuclease N-terminal domain-containing protein [Methylobacterium fujisawaense]
MHGAVILSRRPEVADIFPEASEKAVGRSPRTAGSGRQNRLPSLKAERTIRCASNLEFDHALDCELSPSVSRIVEQPCTLRYVLEGQSRIAKPDAFVIERRVPELRELKHEKRAAEPENEARWEAIAAAVNSMGFGYRVVTEDDLEEGGRLNTIRTVFEHRQSPIPSDSDLALLDKILSNGGLKLGYIAKALPFIQRDQIFALVRRGMLALDFSRPISSDTLVMLPTHWTGVQFGRPL